MTRGLGWLWLGCFSCLGLGCASWSRAFVGRGPLGLFSSSRHVRGLQQGPVAVGHFPAREVFDTTAPPRQAILEKLQAEVTPSNVYEHTEEVRLLRDQTALLAQDLHQACLFAASLLDALDRARSSGCCGKFCRMDPWHRNSRVSSKTS